MYTWSRANVRAAHSRHRHRYSNRSSPTRRLMAIDMVAVGRHSLRVALAFAASVVSWVCLQRYYIRYRQHQQCQRY